MLIGPSGLALVRTSNANPDAKLRHAGAGLPGIGLGCSPYSPRGAKVGLLESSLMRRDQPA